MSTSRGLPKNNGSASPIVVAATFKILVLGNSDVGKSSLIQKYTTGRVTKSLLPTVGIDFTDVIIAVRGTKVKLRIWDTAGQERFRTFTRQFFRGTQGILLVYDVTSMASFQTLLMWMQTIKEAGLEGISTVIVGNKVDLEERRQVPKETGEKLAARHAYLYIETSAKTGHQVKKAFYELAEVLIHSHGIFQPGREASAIHRRIERGNTSWSSADFSDDEWDQRWNTGPSSTHTNNSFVLDDSQDKPTPKCCRP